MDSHAKQREQPQQPPAQREEFEQNRTEHEYQRQIRRSVQQQSPQQQRQQQQTQVPTGYGLLQQTDGGSGRSAIFTRDTFDAESSFGSGSGSAVRETTNTNTNSQSVTPCASAAAAAATVTTTTTASAARVSAFRMPHSFQLHADGRRPIAHSASSSSNTSSSTNATTVAAVKVRRGSLGVPPMQQTQQIQQIQQMPPSSPSPTATAAATDPSATPPPISKYYPASALKKGVAMPAHLPLPRYPPTAPLPPSTSHSHSNTLPQSSSFDYSYFANHNMNPHPVRIPLNDIILPDSNSSDFSNNGLDHRPTILSRPQSQTELFASQLHSQSRHHSRPRSMPNPPSLSRSQSQPHAHHSRSRSRSYSAVLIDPRIAQVRRNWLQHVWSNFNNISRHSKLLLVATCLVMVSEIVVGTFSLLIAHSTGEVCDTHLDIYLVVFVLREILSLPLVIYQYLHSAEPTATTPISQQPQQQQSSQNANRSLTAPLRSNSANSVLEAMSPSPSATLMSQTSSTSRLLQRHQYHSRSTASPQTPSKELSALVGHTKSTLDAFALIWFIVGNWFVFTSTACFRTAPLLYYCSLAFLSVGYVLVCVPIIMCFGIVFCLPVVLVWAKYMRTGSSLPSFTAVDVNNGQNNADDDDEDKAGLGAPDSVIKNIPILIFKQGTDDGSGGVVDKKRSSGYADPMSAAFPVTESSGVEHRRTAATATGNKYASNSGSGFVATLYERVLSEVRDSLDGAAFRENISSSAPSWQSYEMQERRRGSQEYGTQDLLEAESDEGTLEITPLARSNSYGKFSPQITPAGLSSNEFQQQPHISSSPILPPRPILTDTSFEQNLPELAPVLPPRPTPRLAPILISKPKESIIANPPAITVTPSSPLVATTMPVAITSSPSATIAAHSTALPPRPSLKKTTGHVVIPIDSFANGVSGIGATGGGVMPSLTSLPTSSSSLRSMMTAKPLVAPPLLAQFEPDLNHQQQLPPQPRKQISQSSPVPPPYPPIQLRPRVMGTQAKMPPQLLDSVTGQVVTELGGPEDAVCVICLFCYEDGEEVRKLVCGHHFHVQCVDEWLRLNKTCPLCVRDITKYSAGTIA